LSQPHRQDLNWLVTDFTTRVEDVAHAIVVSADGVPLALSEGIPEHAVGKLAAIISGLASLVLGAARVFAAGVPTQALVEMENGLMFVKSISDGSNLAVLAAPECDTRQVSFEMTRLVGAVGDVLTPAARDELAIRASRYQPARAYPDAGAGARQRGTPAAVTPAAGREGHLEGR
jgi:predicted regulator of Ras-like GTPase activity (Roadblock/LC7/MglB family)